MGLSEVNNNDFVKKVEDREYTAFLHPSLELLFVGLIIQFFIGWLSLFELTCGTKQISNSSLKRPLFISSPFILELTSGSFLVGDFS